MYLWHISNTPTFMIKTPQAPFHTIISPRSPDTYVHTNTAGCKSVNTHVEWADGVETFTDSVHVHSCVHAPP